MTATTLTTPRTTSRRVVGVRRTASAVRRITAASSRSPSYSFTRTEYSMAAGDTATKPAIATDNQSPKPSRLATKYMTGIHATPKRNASTFGQTLPLGPSTIHSRWSIV